MTITKEEAIAKYGEANVFTYHNGDWAWIDEDKYYHLMRLIDVQWIELTKGLKAIGGNNYYPNGDWMWVDENKYWHLMRLINQQWIDLTKNCKAIWADSYDNGDWKWQDENSYYHLMRMINDKWTELKIITTT
jgi:hypothetical protein